MSIRSVFIFFGLVFALSIPFWIVGVATGAELSPGLPVAAMQFVCPVLAASILAFRESGISGVSALLKRAVDVRRIDRKIWFVPIFFLTPLILVVSYGVMRGLGLPLPVPRFSILTSVWLFAVFLVAAECEELGWSGFATDRLQRRWPALAAALVIGTVWALWHVIPLIQAHRSAAWITGWGLGTVASRVLIVWRYNNTNASVFAASLCHDVDNVSWLMFPNGGSHYDARVTGPITALAAAVVLAMSETRTLRHRERSEGSSQ